MWKLSNRRQLKSKNGAATTHDDGDCKTAARTLPKQASRLEMVERWQSASMARDGIDVKFRLGAPHTWGKAKVVFDACGVRSDGGALVANESMSIEMQLQHKYILSVEGVDKSSNIQWVMLSNSVLVMPPPSQESWLLEGRLTPWVHFAPVRPDFKDLKDVVQWLRDHDGYAQKMALASRAYMQSQFGDLDYEFRIAAAVLRLYVAYMHASGTLWRTNPKYLRAPASVKEKLGTMTGKCWQNATWFRKKDTLYTPPVEHEEFQQASSRFQVRFLGKRKLALEVAVPLGMDEGDSFFLSLPTHPDDANFDPNGVSGVSYDLHGFVPPVRIKIPPKSRWTEGQRSFRLRLDREAGPVPETAPSDEGLEAFHPSKATPLSFASIMANEEFTKKKDKKRRSERDAAQKSAFSSSVKSYPPLESFHDVLASGDIEAEPHVSDSHKPTVKHAGRSTMAYKWTQELKSSIGSLLHRSPEQHRHTHKQKDAAFDSQEGGKQNLKNHSSQEVSHVRDELMEKLEEERADLLKVAEVLPGHLDELWSSSKSSGDEGNELLQKNGKEEVDVGTATAPKENGTTHGMVNAEWSGLLYASEKKIRPIEGVYTVGLGTNSIKYDNGMANRTSSKIEQAQGVAETGAVVMRDLVTGKNKDTADTENSSDAVKGDAKKGSTLSISAHENYSQIAEMAKKIKQIEERLRNMGDIHKIDGNNNASTTSGTAITGFPVSNLSEAGLEIQRETERLPRSIKEKDPLSLHADAATEVEGNSTSQKELSRRKHHHHNDLTRSPASTMLHLLKKHPTADLRSLLHLHQIRKKHEGHLSNESAKTVGSVVELSEHKKSMPHHSPSKTATSIISALDAFLNSPKHPQTKPKKKLQQIPQRNPRKVVPASHVFTGGPGSALYAFPGTQQKSGSDSPNESIPRAPKVT